MKLPRISLKKLFPFNMRKWWLISFLFIFAIQVKGDELICTATILDNQIQLSDKRIFRKLEQAITNFVNNTRWTTEKVEPNERIEINFQIILTQFDVNNSSYKGSCQIQSRRPVFGTSYNTILFNINDENWEFIFNEFDPMVYNDNAYSTNLISLLSFYVYYVIAMDFDSFGLYAGNPYLNKAFNIANNAQPTGLAGWQPFERNIRSRYNLIDNVMNDRFKPLREANYKYHRQGLDRMGKEPENARKQIFASLELVQKVFKVAPNTVMLLVFFESKSDELVNIFKGAPANEKPKVIALLNEINIANANKYEKIKG